VVLVRWLGACSYNGAVVVGREASRMEKPGAHEAKDKRRGMGTVVGERFGYSGLQGRVRVGTQRCLTPVQNPPAHLIANSFRRKIMAQDHCLIRTIPWEDLTANQEGMHFTCSI